MLKTGIKLKYGLETDIKIKMDCCFFIQNLPPSPVPVYLRKQCSNLNFVKPALEIRGTLAGDAVIRCICPELIIEGKEIPPTPQTLWSFYSGLRVLSILSVALVGEKVNGKNYMFHVALKQDKAGRKLIFFSNWVIVCDVI